MGAVPRDGNAKHEEVVGIGYGMCEFAVATDDFILQNVIVK